MTQPEHHTDPAVTGDAERCAAGEHAELLSRLAALRDSWTARQLADVYTRETADGASAHIASLRADLVGQMLAEFAQALTVGAQHEQA